MNESFQFLVCSLILAQIVGNVFCYRDYEHCGRIAPVIKSYIYGGKASMIEQWPWQV
jgi:hypothetical protein